MSCFPEVLNRTSPEPALVTENEKGSSTSENNTADVDVVAFWFFGLGRIES